MSNNSTNNAKGLAYYMRLPYAIHIQADECGGKPCFLAVHPELYGCMAQGDTPQEALDNLKEARKDYLETLLELGRDIPEPNSHFSVQTVSVSAVQVWANVEEGFKATNVATFGEINPIGSGLGKETEDVLPVRVARPILIGPKIPITA